MNLRAYLGGIANVDPRHLVIISECVTLRSLAQADVERRIVETLGELGDEEVHAIACGDVDLRQLARDSSAEKIPKGTNDVEQPMLSVAAYSELERIARSTMGIPTLQTRHTRALDFHDLAVWTIETALEQAYIAGMTDHRR
jgi:hypothetical protein